MTTRQAPLRETETPAAAPVSGTSVAGQDIHPSNTALYADTRFIEGIDYARRFRIHGTTAAIIAPHGGYIELGTSELCLAIAGRHPASLELIRPAYDFWIFEGLRPVADADLHIASTHCDDPIAEELCLGCGHVLSLHGCLPRSAGLPDDARVILIGGRDRVFRERLHAELGSARFDTIDATGHASLGGMSPDNIVNRSLPGMGAQLEITSPLRHALFDSLDGRAGSTTELFWNLVNAIRTALTRTGLTAGQALPEVSSPTGQDTPVPPIPQ